MKHRFYMFACLFAIFMVGFSDSAHAGATAATPSEIADKFIDRHAKDAGKPATTSGNSFQTGETKVSHGDGKPSVERGPIKVELEYDPEEGWKGKPKVKNDATETEIGWEDGKPTISINVFNLIKKYIIGAGLSKQMHDVLVKIDKQVGFVAKKTRGSCKRAAMRQAWSISSDATKSRVLRGAGTIGVDIVETLVSFPTKITESVRSELLNIIKAKVEAQFTEAMQAADPEKYSMSKAVEGCDVQMRVIWNKQTGTYHYIITGDCKCNKVWVSEGERHRGKVKLNRFTVTGEGTIGPKVHIKRGKGTKLKPKVSVKFGIGRPSVNLVPNCQCAKKIEDPPPLPPKPPRIPIEPRDGSLPPEDGVEIELEDAVSQSGVNAFDANEVEDVVDSGTRNTTGNTGTPKPPEKPKDEQPPKEPKPEEPKDETPPPPPEPKDPPPPPPPPPPLQVSVDGPPRLFFFHKVGTPPEGSPCPTPAGNLRIRSNNGNPLQISNVQVSGPLSSRVSTQVLDSTKTSPTLTAAFNCSSPEPGNFTGTLTFTVTDTVTGESKQVSHPIAGTVQ